MSSEISIKEYTIKNIDEIFFNIPIYQRPYAWSTKEVKALLDDFDNAFKKKTDYYIGNIVAFPNSNKLDIVDGQQRFTTLFLIGVIAEWGNNIKLNYEIREKDREFLKKINKGNIENEYKDINHNLIENLRFIKSFLNEKNDDDFINWIYSNVKFVLTKLTKEIDVNKYFEVMNNRGVQLEKHHILKANLLHNMEEDNKQKYAKIWDYCSDMNVYLEEYILKDAENDEKIKEIRKKLLDNPIEIFEGDKNKKENLFGILEKDKKDKKVLENEAEKAKNSTKQLYKSIINFETFLLHIYKITKDKDDKVKINDSDLLETIKIEEGKEKEFIEAILEYRILFDYFVLKRDKEQKPYLKLIDVDKNDGTIKTDAKLLMIELLFEITSSKFNLWLTDFLKKVKEEKDNNKLINYLEKKDNQEAKERKEKELKKEEYNKFENILNQGTATPHYWFYKLEYLLWRDYDWSKINDKIETSYRLKNLVSIEHIQPQNPEHDCNNWGDCDINNFGNLALISKHMNSKLSNQCFNNKKSDIEKQINNGTLESLKMLLIYSKYSEWNAKYCEEHQEEMVNILLSDQNEEPNNDPF